MDAPKDHNDNPLKVGDVVAISGEIIAMNDDKEWVNVIIETRWPMFPSKNKTPIFLNSSQVLLLKTSLRGSKDAVVAMNDVMETIKATGHFTEKHESIDS